VDSDVYPARGAVDGHEEIASAGLVGPLGQVFDVHVQVAGQVGLERLVSGLLGGRQEVAQIAHPVPAQTAVQSGARHVRADKLAHHGQQVVQRQQQAATQIDRDRLLGGRERGLQAMGSVGTVVEVVARATCGWWPR